MSAMWKIRILTECSQVFQLAVSANANHSKKWAADVSFVEDLYQALFSFGYIRETKIQPDLRLMLLFIVIGVVNELEMA